MGNRIKGITVEIGGDTTGLDKASTAYASAMIGTGTLLVIIPLIIVYLFAQKGFVESLSQSGIKM